MRKVNTSTSERPGPKRFGGGLSDSPVGLATWILKKLHALTDREGQQPLTRLCTPPTSASTSRGRCRFIRMSCPSSRAVGLPAFADLRSWTDMPHGGHFAALEAPDLLSEDVVTFLAGLASACGHTPR